ncbi:MAG: sigma-70 family RNA polymerase sigma factor [Bacteroidota bacterium]
MAKDKAQNWLKVLRSGDRRGVQQIYEQFLPGIVKLVTSNHGSREQAIDVFQEAILIIFKKSKEESFSLESSFFTYLYAISRNLWLKKLEKNKKNLVTFSHLPEPMSTDDFDTLILEEERYRLFRSKFRQLSDNCQQLLSLFFKKTPMVDIVRIMGFGSVQYAKKRKFQCKEKLVKLVKDDIEYNNLKNG